MTRLYRPAQTVELVGLSNMHLLRMERAGRFPKRFKLNPDAGTNGASAHLAEEVDAWIAERAASRDVPQAA